MDISTITLIIGLAIMLIGGLATTFFIKDEEKMYKCFGIVELIGCTITILSVCFVFI